MAALNEELKQFTRNYVWSRVPKTDCMNLIGTKWVFRNKLDEGGVITRNKARLVVDTTQVATKMTKEAKDKAHGEQSSQRTFHNPTKNHMDLTRGAEHRPTHQLFFLLVFLQDTNML